MTENMVLILLPRRAWRPANRRIVICFSSCVTDVPEAPRRSGWVDPVQIGADPGMRLPFDPFLQGRFRLADIPVERWGYGPVIEESYVVGTGGVVSLRITDTETGFSQV